MTMPGGHGPWMVMRSYRRDTSVTDQKLSKGTLGRIAGFARPYRFDLTVFLVTVTASAVIGVVTPVLAGRVVNVISSHGAPATVVKIAVLVAILAVFDAGLSLAQRWYSARIGEGLILDLRTRVFDHVQRMPLAFFTRTQTGALISRLNNDVIGAQQAFTSTLSGVVSNVIALVLTAGVMFSLSWQITVLSLILLPVFVLPARRIGQRLQAITRESYGLNASMNATMTERFNVSGALLVKLFGRPAEESRSFGERAGRVRDIGVVSAMYARTFFVALTLVAALAQALVYGLGGYYALTGRLDAGTVVTLALLLTRLYGPLTALSNVRVDVMSALVSFDRVFEVLDIAPMVVDKPGAVTLPADARSIEFDDVRFSYPTADEVSLASLEDVAALDQAPTQEVLHGVTFTAAPGELVALVGPSGAGKTTISMLCRGSTTCARVPYGSAAGTCGTSPSTRCTPRSAWSPRTRTCSTTRSGPTCSMPGRGRPRTRSGRRWPRPRWPSWSAACRTGWRPWSATAATGCPAARSSGSRSPGCCSRRPAS